MKIQFWLCLIFTSSILAKPNFVIFLADDLGYGDVGYQGGEVTTPHIDSIAKGGVTLTNGYVTCPVCAPSRAGLLTGRYQQTFGFWDNIGPYRVSREVEPGIPLEIPILSEKLKKFGYVSGLFGKTHGGDAEKMMPFNRWDQFYGFNNGASNYLAGMNRPHNPIFHNLRIIGQSYQARGISDSEISRKGILLRDREKYLTKVFARRAAAFIERNQKNPFLCYLPFNAIHGPFQAPEDLYEKYSSEKDHKRRLTMAMIDSLDQAVGIVLDALERFALEENTLVIFLSDNGGHEASSCLPLRGKKATFWEGGLRVPFCMKWPGRLQPGKIYGEPVISLDILPTLVSAAGEQLDPSWNLDGMDLLPYLSDPQTAFPRRSLLWTWGPRKAIRMGRYKAVTQNQGRSWGLYDLHKDLSEKRDLSKEQPQRMERMVKQFLEWEKNLMPQQWGWSKDLGFKDPDFGKPRPYHKPGYFKKTER